MALKLSANRKYPNIPQISDDPKSHTRALIAIAEILEIGNRRTKDLNNSFVRVGELIDLGLITVQGNVNSLVGVDLGSIADLGDLTGAAEGDFLRFVGGEWVNDDLHTADVTQAMVIQHLNAVTFLTSGDETANFPGSRQVLAGTGITVDTSTPGQFTIAASGGGGGGTVDSVVEGTNIDVDATDPANPIVSLDSAAISALAAAASALQPGATIPWSDLSGVPSTFPPDLTGIDTDDIPEGTNKYFTDERVDDRVAALLVAGTNVTLTYNDVANTLTVAATGGGGGGASYLQDLLDVDLLYPTDGLTLVYSTATGLWEATDQRLLPVTSYGASITLQLTDAATGVQINNASANTVTVPPNSGVAFPVGTVVPIVQVGVGLTTIVAGVGVTLRYHSDFNLALRGQYAQAGVRKIATNEWIVFGDLDPV
jgi:hypothetical protein